jgi:hypothetical protein
VFEPFFRTKGEVLGMELSIRRSIIRARGQLWAENCDGRGAILNCVIAHSATSHGCCRAMTARIVAAKESSADLQADSLGPLPKMGTAASGYNVSKRFLWHPHFSDTGFSIL